MAQIKSQTASPKKRAKTNNKKTALHSAQTHTCKIVCDYLLAAGYERDRLSAFLDCDLGVFEDEEGRIGLDRYYALWEEAVTFTGEPDLALKLASGNVMEGMGLVGHVFFNCKTLQSAIEHYQRYYRLINESVEVELIVEDDLARIHYSIKGGLAYSQYEMEYTVALAAERARRLLQSGLDVRYVAFGHKQPDYLSTYQSVFRCPVEFEKANSSIAFDARYLDFKMPRNSPTLYKVLTVHLDRLLSALGKRTDLISKVEALVRKKISDPELDADYVAERLNMSRNTLHRHLKREGFSYHDIVDDVRSTLALEALKSGGYSVTELAFVLGFSETSAFSRAFKRWTGMTPNAYMKKR